AERIGGLLERGELRSERSVGGDRALDQQGLVGLEDAERVQRQQIANVADHAFSDLPATARPDRRRSRPAAMRDFTVPIGIATRSAISLHDRPSKYASSRTRRWSEPSSASAWRTRP